MEADDYNLKWNNFETGITRKDRDEFKHQSFMIRLFYFIFCFGSFLLLHRLTLNLIHLNCAVEV